MASRSGVEYVLNQSWLRYSVLLEQCGWSKANQERVREARIRWHTWEAEELSRVGRLELSRVAADHLRAAERLLGGAA